MMVKTADDQASLEGVDNGLCTAAAMAVEVLDMSHASGDRYCQLVSTQLLAHERLTMPASDVYVQPLSVLAETLLADNILDQYIDEAEAALASSMCTPLAPLSAAINVIDFSGAILVCCLLFGLGVLVHIAEISSAEISSAEISSAEISSVEISSGPPWRSPTDTPAAGPTHARSPPAAGASLYARILRTRRQQVWQATSKNGGGSELVPGAPAAPTQQEQEPRQALEATGNEVGGPISYEQMKALLAEYGLVPSHRTAPPAFIEGASTHTDHV